LRRGALRRDVVCGAARRGATLCAVRRGAHDVVCGAVGTAGFIGRGGHTPGASKGPGVAVFTGFARLQAP
jgi:hypothetical protein